MMLDRSIRTKPEAISAILDRLVEAGALAVEEREGTLIALLKREMLGTTGIGKGVAIPHAHYPGLPSVVGAVADFPGGVDFDALDGEPVYLVCLLISPTDRRGEVLRMLAALARKLRAAP